MYFAHSITAIKKKRNYGLKRARSYAGKNAPASTSVFPVGIPTCIAEQDTTAPNVVASAREACSRIAARCIKRDDCWERDECGERVLAREEEDHHRFHVGRNVRKALEETRGRKRLYTKIHFARNRQAAVSTITGGTSSPGQMIRSSRVCLGAVAPIRDTRR